MVCVRRRGWLVGIAMVAMATGCEEDGRPEPPEAPLVQPPDLSLATDAWPVWVPAMQVPGCRADAEALAERVREAEVAEGAARTRIERQARRRLAELAVCLERRRVALRARPDPIHDVEVAVEIVPEGALAVDAAAVRRCHLEHWRDGDVRSEVGLHAEVGDRERIELARVETNTGLPELGSCLARGLERARVLTPSPGVVRVRALARGGRVFERPCIDESLRPRHRVNVTRVERVEEGAFEEDRAPDLEVFLYYEGTRLTSIPSEGAADVRFTDEPRATLRCPIAFGAERPLGVLVLDARGDRDRVLGYGELRDATPGSTRVTAGHARVDLEILP